MGGQVPEGGGAITGPVQHMALKCRCELMDLLQLELERCLLRRGLVEGAIDQERLAAPIQARTIEVNDGLAAT
jgi:hypothetical protein